MRKGFTLIELLVSLAILATLILITVPVVNNIVENSKDKAYEETKRSIQTAANLYVIKNLKNFSEEIGSRSFIPISDLKDSGYLKDDIADPRTGEVINDGEVMVELNAAGDYKYKYLPTGYNKSGLVLWYDAFNRGTVNNVWQDLSGNNNNGTLLNFLFNGSSGWQANHLAFSSTTETITATNPLVAQTSNLQSYTVLVTFNLTASSTVGPRIIGINNGLYLAYSAAGKALHYINSGVNDYYTYGISATPINQNIQYAFRFNKNSSTNTMKVQLHKNGITEAANNFPENVAKLAFGMSPNIVINNMTNIKLYSVKIYNRVLTDQEVMENYEVDHDRFDF